MGSELNSLCFYVRERVCVSDLSSSSYISTENMLPDKGGVTQAAALPRSVQAQRYCRGDVLVSNIRPYFKKIWLADRDGGCSSDVLVFRARDACDSRFLYYVLADDAFFSYAAATAKGTKMPRGDKAAIMRYEIPDAALEAQRRMADLLYPLDQKIQLNRNINDNLERQAQAVFGSLFLTGAASGWRQGRLSDLAVIKYGKDHKKLADGIYPVFGSGGVMRYVERPLYDRESVLIPRKGTLNHVLYVNEPFWSVDTMFYTEMRFPNAAKYVFHLMKAKDLASLNTGSAVPSMTADTLNKIELAIPPRETLEQFEKTVSPMYAAMQQNKRESAVLARLRDALLPKLLSGEIVGPVPAPVR